MCIRVTYVLFLEPLDTKRKMNVQKTFRRRPEDLCTFNLHPVSRGKMFMMQFYFLIYRTYLMFNPDYLYRRSLKKCNVCWHWMKIIKDETEFMSFVCCKSIVSYTSTNFESIIIETFK